ncbi:hypothetical protein Sjap_022296 [Stephania japonica]|uniref:Uncharacterized protein n=1 Tax=Stephania japonica TaxID=461633 RepID=A0AAP0EP29_9MAGN
MAGRQIGVHSDLPKKKLKLESQSEEMEVTEGAELSRGCASLDVGEICECVEVQEEEEDLIKEVT